MKGLAGIGVVEVGEGCGLQPSDLQAMVGPGAVVVVESDLSLLLSGDLSKSARTRLTLYQILGTLQKHPEVLDRHLHNLPPAPACQNTHDTKIKTDLTESFLLGRRAITEAGITCRSFSSLPFHRSVSVSATTVLSVLLGLLFVVTGGVKVLGVPQSLAIRDHFHLPPRLWQAVGALETAGGVGVLVGLAIPVLGATASAGLAALMVGATVNRLRVHDPAVMVVLDLTVLGLVLALAALRTSA
ncbi:DoxX family protein [Streptomyces europaeiscabiei]|uniref:DoxX family protein n=1 Tax=Streptomyces europaeiscabiei TaxID=146819 RepID=UPI002E2662A5|nr:DoxX family protein [Streptomyces europaeiscabiei]